MKRAIAKIKLAPGNAGWFDPLTNIYLTLSKKECFVYNDQDVSNIRKAIKQNKLVLKEGRLPSPVSEEKKETVKKSIKKQIAQEVVKVEKVEKDEVIKQVEVIEKKEIKPFIKEETIEEVKTEKTPKKKVKRRPDESKLLKQEEENKEEVVEEKKEDVVDPLVKVAELIKVKAEDDNNG